MIQTNTGVKTNEEQLAALYQMMQANNDEENAKKVLDLYDKLYNEELIVSFSGHFSAGKSSMINTLLGKDILPKSPIPTSANIVKINSGEGWARVFFTDGDPVEYQEPYDLDMIKTYSKDKETIQRIEISTKDKLIPNGAAIMDTPGIDAADDADRLMTESALHLVDVLFYVMDYNHVQSEVNLYFLQSLQNNHIPFYLIINQIDKHNEEELSFASFKESIRKTFSDWDIHPLGVFYTSLFDSSLPTNELDRVKETLFSILQNEEKKYFNIDASVQQVINKHKLFLEEQYEALKSDIEIDEDIEARLDEIEKIEDRLAEISKEPEELEQAFQHELKYTLQNAYLMPKALRDKAQQFLESQQPGFKVGLFGSKRKTEEEKSKRLEDFMQSLQETMETAIRWKLRDKYLQLLRDFNLSDQALIEKVNQFVIEYDSSELLNLLKPGAQINGEYVLNYTNDVAADVKSKYKRKSLDLLHSMKKALQDKHASTVSENQSIYDNLQEVKEIQSKYNKIEQEMISKQEAIDRMLHDPIINKEDWQRTVELLHERQEFIKGEQPVIKSNDLTVEAEQEIDSSHPSDSTEFTVDQVIEYIEQAINLTESLPGFNNLIDELQVKKDRLANRTFTIALFGAFSAGKSSFSNALIGEKVLPVSPNPTTATVNRIHPVSVEHPHGTIVVTMKKEEDLREELIAMTKNLSPKGEDLHRLLSWMEKKSIVEDRQLNNMYQAYIHALLKGYPANKENLGKKVTITLDDFAKYVTDETIACYIEAIDLYYDCSITRQGITLVDTPGADSVNARHTNVAFNYIKHADAILYVTYYNHALSRADRDFLMQLGRVKEAFQLDKMFFIVNAADLAESEEELQLVTSYVNEELLRLGIRQARIFPVSSKQSLVEKLNSHPLNELMKDFEDHFYSFIHRDLAALTIESALWDIKRLQQTMEQYISTASLDASDKAKQIEKIKQEQKQAITLIKSYETDVYDKQIIQRIEKQLYYVIERLAIRYHDMFKEMFNPTTITENGRKAYLQLKLALENLIEYIRFELNQELQAISLRIEGYSLELANEVYQVMNEKIIEINDLFTLSKQFDYELNTPEYEKELVDIQLKDFQFILGKYKGTKAFFVQNEKEIMKEQLYEALLPSIKTFIKTNQGKMLTSYVEQWKELIVELKNSASGGLNQQVENYFTMLEAPTNLEKMHQNLQELRKLAKRK